ncbi:MAG: hydroxysqualene dehydroxylase HpnE [Thermogutta sp.]
MAGISAAWYLRKAGFQVTIFEARHRFGGRARSFYDSRMGNEVDTCQHIALGCCTAFLHFCRETRLLSFWERHRTFYFVDRAGQVHHFSPSRWLIPPLHLLPAVAQLRFLSLADRVSLLKGLYRLSREKESDHHTTMGEWLPTHRQSPYLIENFWTPILVSAVSERIEDIPLAVARKVLVEGLMATRDGFQLWVPTLPLSRLFDEAISTRLGEIGINLVKGAIVKSVCQRELLWKVELAHGSTLTFDGVVMAVPWRTALRVLPRELRNRVLPHWEERIQDSQGRNDSCAITAVHLWFDLPCFPWPHAVLLGRRSQWVFRPGFVRNTGLPRGASGHVNTGITANANAWICQTVVSASHRLPKMTPEQWITVAVEELKAVFPAARKATFLHGRVVTEPAAVLSPAEEWNRLRPPQATSVPGLVLAGDWTATGWPGTMESAIRSGIAAAEAMTSHFRVTEPR